MASELVHDSYTDRLPHTTGTDLKVTIGMDL